MTDHSWQKTTVDGLEYDTNGINMVRLHGITIQYGTRTHKRVLAAFDAKHGPIHIQMIGRGKRPTAGQGELIMTDKELRMWSIEQAVKHNAGKVNNMYGARNVLEDARKFEDAVKEVKDNASHTA